ncbi:MAG: peptidoglycan DD-metalloendopeptidase family protein [Acaryochloris sp. RU_4_1]|nr:peptidoglycan DD-metalloendopeptidase family protein [Acaryochloris sp. RU_4_1]NJR56385.1 peptidoglycan DD-metalloendopeptidase family protein [Acaryochloris sp. CRU_2_0]
MFFTQHCTAHIISLPTPWKITRDSLFPVLSRRRIQDLFPGINEQARTVDFCQVPTFLANSGRTDSPDGNPPNETQYGHHAFAETSDQLYEVISVDGVKEALTKEAAEAFEQMHADAAAQGLDIRAVSGFRDKQTQQELFELQTQRQGSPEAAAKVSAPPGYSEHHTGLAVDVGTNANPRLDTGFANTPEYAWMQKNAGNYGFELSFPENNSQGVSFEPWHWRYVGSDQAAATFSPAAGDGHNHGTTETSTPSGPEHNLRQYLARIALGESNGGSNIGPHPKTAAYGEYQFIPSTRDTILERYGLDAWSENKAERDQAALALIQDFGNEIGTDIIGLIEAGDFATADKLLGQHVYDANGQVARWAQFTSLPGGAEESTFWQDPALLAQYGPDGDAGTNPLLPALNANSQRCNPGQLASNESSGPFTEGSGVASGQLQDPLAGQTYVVTSNYGLRTHPTTGETSFHHGIDLAWDSGTPIKAADGGVVVMSKWNGGYGNYILIDHGNGLATWYGHNSANYVKVGDKVDRGQEIGAIGSTGRSTGPHLDFGVIEGYQTGSIDSGQDVDPRKYINFPSKR